MAGFLFYMPSISLRGSQLPASPIRKLAPYAAEAKRRNRHVYHLNIGQPDIQTPKGMIEAVKNISFDVWAYTASEGLDSYRKKLAGYYKRFAYPIEPNHILVTTGGSEAILMAMTCCLDKGDELIVTEPFYANYNGFGDIAGITLVPVPSTIESGFELPPLEEFSKRITNRTRGIMICSPNNPTGYIYTRVELEKLAELVICHGLYLFCDEAYREFCYDGASFFSPMHLDSLSEHLIVLDTVSKRYSACGARLGALITRNEDVLSSCLRFAQARLCPPLVAQIAAEAAIDTPDSYFEAVTGEYTARRNTLVAALNKIDGVFAPQPKGAFYVMARLPIDDCDRFCQWMLESFEYQNATVMMAPGTGFYANSEHGKQEVRLAYVLCSEDLTKAMICLEEGLKVYPGRLTNNIQVM